MAQLRFFATDRDCNDLWGFLLSELKLHASPDPWFGELPVPTLKTRNDVAANLKQYPRLAPGLSYFLTSPDWSPEPLVYDRCSDNPNFAPYWYVRKETVDHPFISFRRLLTLGTRNRAN